MHLGGRSLLERDEPEALVLLLVSLHQLLKQRQQRAFLILCDKLRLKLEKLPCKLLRGGIVKFKEDIAAPRRTAAEVLKFNLHFSGS